MKIKGIAVIGQNRLAKELFASFQDVLIDEVSFNDFSTLNKMNVVIETTNLDLDTKKRNLLEIESQTSSDALILSTSLQVTATEAASWLTHSERLVGFATFANFKEGQLIEIAPPLQADLQYLESVKETFSFIGQQIEIVEDEVGLVFPRILSMIINEAAFALTEGTAEAKAIDQAMKKGTNYPLGPLEWAEKIGLDDVYAVLSGLYREFGEERYRPAPLIRKLIHAGWVGGDTDRGFYHYQNRKAKEFST